MGLVSPKTKEAFKGALDKITGSKVKMFFINFVLAGLVWVFIVLNFIKQIFQPFYRFLFAARHPVLVRTPEERFTEVGLEDLGYNFASNYIDLPFGQERPRMHYIDEYMMDDKALAQETILCLHGEPTWSFLYRKMIPRLVAAGYRVVVPDFIGFGKSDKYVDPENYNHEFHMMCIRHLMQELNLDSDVTLVCQDWGGLVGLSLVKDTPDVFSNLVIMNTGLPTGVEHESFFENPLKAISEILPFLLWRSSVAFFGTSYPISFLFRRIARFPKDSTDAYTAPFPSHLYMGGMAKWPLLVPLYRDDPVAQHMVEARNCLRTWNKPALIMFGDQDAITGPQQKLFRDLLPHASYISVKGADHFLQETHGPQLSDNIVKFLTKKLS
jgi:haloalkane dehalogenase